MTYKKRTYRLTTNNAEKIEDFYYCIVRDDDAILYSNNNRHYVFKEFCELALSKEMHGELHNFIIEA